MTAKEFRNVFEAQPFRPFSVFLADGRQVPVKHQEFAMLSPSGRTLIVYQEDDSFQEIDLMLATGVEVNGTRRKARRDSSEQHDEKTLELESFGES